MTRIWITQEAWDAIASQLPPGTRPAAPERRRGMLGVWLERKAFLDFMAARRPSESYSDAILRIAKEVGYDGPSRNHANAAR